MRLSSHLSKIAKKRPVNTYESMRVVGVDDFADIAKFPKTKPDSKKLAKLTKSIRDSPVDYVSESNI